MHCCYIRNTKKAFIKGTLLTAIFTFLFTATACDNFRDKNKISEEKLIDIYKEILKTRESEVDVELANKKVNEILKKSGLSQQSFAEEVFALTKNNKEFIVFLDSLRQTIKRDTTVSR